MRSAHVLLLNDLSKKVQFSELYISELFQSFEGFGIVDGRCWTCTIWLTPSFIFLDLYSMSIYWVVMEDLYKPSLCKAWHVGSVQFPIIERRNEAQIIVHSSMCH